MTWKEAASGAVAEEAHRQPADRERQANVRLRRERRLRGWSQDDVAAGLRCLTAGQGGPELGVEATTVSRWERGVRRPRPRYARLLCQLFELEAVELGLIEEQQA